MAQKINNDILSMKHWFDEIPQLVAIGDGSRFIKVNKMFESILGWTPEEITKLEWLSLVHPDDFEPTVNEYYASGGCLLNFFNRYRKIDGSYVWLQWTISKLKYGEVYASAIPHLEDSFLRNYFIKLSRERRFFKKTNSPSASEVIENV